MRPIIPGIRIPVPSAAVSRSILGAATLGMALLASLPDASRAQPPMSMPETGSAQAGADSLKREITRRILSDADKKEIRACDRDKSRFLKQCRTSDRANSDVDKQLNEAKLNGVDPNDPSIQALLEKKFILEKGCDDKFTATARGKQCGASEAKRQAALEKALARDKDYQKLLQRARSAGSEHL